MCSSVRSFFFYTVLFSSPEHNYSEPKLSWEHRKLLKMWFCSAHITPMKLWLICFLNDSSFILFYSLFKIFLFIYIYQLQFLLPPLLLISATPPTYPSSPIHISQRIRPPLRSQQSLAYKVEAEPSPSLLHQGWTRHPQ